MSLTSTAAAIAAFFTPGEVEYLSSFYEHPPKITPEQQWYQADVEFPSGSGKDGSGAVIYMDLGPRRQKRLAGGGRPAGSMSSYEGKKWAQMTCTFLCYFRSSKDRSEDVGADNYLFLDSLEARLLSDKNLGTVPFPQTGEVPPGAIFQAGEGSDVGGDDITIVPGLPVTLSGGITQIFSTFKFEVCEVLNS